MREWVLRIPYRHSHCPIAILPTHLHSPEQLKLGPQLDRELREALVPRLVGRKRVADAPAWQPRVSAVRPGRRRRGRRRGRRRRGARAGGLGCSPTRSRASSTMTFPQPRSRRLRAAMIPAAPAPITTTVASLTALAAALAISGAPAESPCAYPLPSSPARVRARGFQCSHACSSLFCRNVGLFCGRGR